MVASVHSAAPDTVVVSCSEGWTWTRAVHHYHTWLSARPSAQESVAKAADTDRPSIWLKRTRESCSPPRGLLAGCGYAIKALSH